MALTFEKCVSHMRITQRQCDFADCARWAGHVACAYQAPATAHGQELMDYVPFHVYTSLLTYFVVSEVWKSRYVSFIGVCLNSVSCQWPCHSARKAWTQCHVNGHAILHEKLLGIQRVHRKPADTIPGLLNWVNIRKDFISELMVHIKQKRVCGRL